MTSFNRAPVGLQSKNKTMRPPPQRRIDPRAQTCAPAPNSRSQSGAISPANSVASLSTSTSTLRSRSPTHTNAGTKRKERDFDGNDGGEETNIHVVVRCRGRSDREVRENSGVVVSTDGVKGKIVELSMGPNASSNKTYHFDKVFSPAADQAMIYDDVVTPLLDEVNYSNFKMESFTNVNPRCCKVSTALFSPTGRREPERRTQCLVICPIHWDCFQTLQV